VGPDFPAGVVSTTWRSLPDIGPTVGHILGFEMPWATGHAMTELFSAPVGITPPLPPASLGVLRLSPNPLVALQTIEWDASRTGQVHIEVFDLSGRRRRSLEVHQGVSGRARTTWDGADDQGEKLPAGIYVIRVSQQGVMARARTAIIR
jgi:hypothetical protein